MARRRYQKGSLRLRGERNKMWTLRWREDVLEPSGEVRRVERTTVLGTSRDIQTRRIAERRAEAILAQVNRPDYRPVKLSTFAEFVERWRTQALSLMKPSTVHAAESHVRCYLVRRLGKLRLEEITQETAQSLVAELAKRVSRHTVLNVLGTLCSILTSAKQWGYVVSPFKRCSQDSGDALAKHCQALHGGTGARHHRSGRATVAHSLCCRGDDETQAR
jgi:hypothetical protein